MTPTEQFRAARDRLIELREDQDRAHQEHRWPELTHFNWALDWFDAELATRQGDATALKIVGEDAAELSFAALSQRSNRVANSLRDLGVRPGDRILLMLGNCTALWETMLAAMKLGAVTIPTTTLCTPDDVRARIQRAGATYLVTNADLANDLDDLPPSVVRLCTGSASQNWIAYDRLLEGSDVFEPSGPTSADDPILLYFTSGTTAQPKLVVHSHRSYGVGALSTMYWLGLKSDDLHLNVSTPGWAKHAWSCFFAPWNAGAGVFIANQGRFNALTMLQSLVENQVTSICAPPTVWRMLIQENLASFPVALRSACSAGEPLNPEVVDSVEKAWRLTLRDGFGQTETTALIGNAPGQLVKPGSVGRPLPGYDVVLVDADGNEVEEGEIALRLDPRPAGLMAGYIGDGNEIITVDGDYYRTGDVASRDAEGWITYVGRADDVFKASDYRISPFELESALVEHPLILEAAVVPAPDPLRLAVPKAYIALVEAASPSRETAFDIFRHVAATLAPYKRVKRIEFATLPKTISGKIRRVELRRLEVEHYASGQAPADEFRWEDFLAFEENGGTS